MTTEPIDFIALYHELGVDPDGSVDSLRKAYRRRVADLHPDRVGVAGEDGLKSLNLRYAAALDFHRHYGRLPGASPSRGAPRPHARPHLPPHWIEDAPLAGKEARGPSRIVVYGILLLAALAVWRLTLTDAGAPGVHAVGVAGNEREKVATTAIALRHGMPAREVVAMLGEPISRELADTRWVYGPSWVRFECEEVVDWYSSPLKPLKASRSRPPEDEAYAPGLPPRRCAPATRYVP